MSAPAAAANVEVSARAAAAEVEVGAAARANSAAKPQGDGPRDPFRFRHVTTGEVRAEHPLLFVFAQHVQKQRRRKAKPRKWGHLEGWMQFATADGELEYVDLADRLLTPQAALPRLEAPSVRARREQCEHEQAKTKFGAEHAAAPSPSKGRNDIMRLVAQQIEKERMDTRAQCEKEARVTAAGRVQSVYRKVRAKALRLRPSALPEIFVAASALEIELQQSPELAWLAEMLLGCPSTFFPAGWREYKDELSGETRTFYANEISGLLDERAAHPFRIEVRSVKAVVGAMASELLESDETYMETFGENQVLEQAVKRKAAAIDQSAELKMLEELDRAAVVRDTETRLVQQQLRGAGGQEQSGRSNRASLASLTPLGAE
ncbi:hypothetical protein T492DRAFT_1100498 [Pavlovales sp. CCMP2436]|nr:hypothetical protein T492DRAFT_1100498 [Pavlovales sp. CCMP2436]